MGPAATAIAQEIDVGSPLIVGFGATDRAVAQEFDDSPGAAASERAEELGSTSWLQRRSD